MINNYFLLFLSLQFLISHIFSLETVLIDSIPSDAIVHIDGEEQGRTPLLAKLDPSKAHTIHVTKEEYSIAIQRITPVLKNGWMYILLPGGCLFYLLNKKLGIAHTIKEKKIHISLSQSPLFKNISRLETNTTSCMESSTITHQIRC